MNIKNEVLVRVYILLALIVALAIGVFAKAVYINVVEGDKWREQGHDKYVKMVEIEADRGNILAEDGSLLATSLPFFDIAFDPNSTGMSESDFENNIDSLAYCLANFVDPSYTPGGYKDYLLEKRKSGAQYVMIKRDVSFSDMQEIRDFPLFELGQYKGGFIAHPQYHRDRPFGLLAHRTIGYVRNDIPSVGLERSFDHILSGEVGEYPMIQVGKDVWKPVEDLAKIEPKGGNDIKTTLDIDLQDIVEKAVYDAVDRHDADYGVGIVMEVETGAIRAIANLGRTQDGTIWETYNFAVGAATEPGSTFKLAAMMAMLEAGYVNLEDSIDLEKGETEFYEETLRDAVNHDLDSTTIRTAFEQSSNVGMAKLVQRHFGETDRATEFIEYLKKFYLHTKTGVEIEGEAPPYLKDPQNVDDNWSGTTLPWMAFGYEVMLTPLQLLTFYNAVANDGMLMKPYLVSEVQSYGETVDRFPPTIVKTRIASRKTIDQVQSLLLGVVERGTARKLKTDQYTFAGKTGTAQLNYQKLKDRTRVGGYQASFVGYFPAEDPKYSCIVVINDPKRRGIYGGEVALPVFREIADNIFAVKMELQMPLNRQKTAYNIRTLPSNDVGDQRELAWLLEELNIPHYEGLSGGIAVLEADSSGVKMLRRRMPAKQVPNVTGMGLRDALYLLENLGLRVEVKGYGKVRLQSIKPGTPARGQSIRLTLG